MKVPNGAVFSDFDDLIDVAAAEMTQAVPSPGFSTRVMVNLNRAPMAHWPRVATGIAAVAALVLLTLWLPRFRHLGGPSIPDTYPEAAQHANNQAVGQAISQEVPAISTAQRPARVPALSADEAAWLSRAVAPLSATPAIAFDPIQPERSTIAPISVQPLAPEPVELTPLMIPSSSSGGR